jgi:hypothetical protein
VTAVPDANQQSARTGKAKETHPDQQTRDKVTAVQTELRYERWFLPLSVPLGMRPKHSEVRVVAGTLHVKMGWAFDAHIPLASITSAEATNTRVFAWGVHYSGGRWLVNGSGKGLVVLTIEPPAQEEVWINALVAACTVARA